MPTEKGQAKLDRNVRMHGLLTNAEALLTKKSTDYKEDNFIEAAHFVYLYTGAHVTPMIVAAALAGIKISRHKALLLSGTKPVNEPFTDTIMDLLNYIVLENRERERYDYAQGRSNIEESEANRTSGVDES